MRIWKWNLQLTDHQIVNLPIGARILSVAMQDNRLALWALCDPLVDMEPRYIHIFGTGNKLPQEINKYQYLSTFQLENGALVFHAFAELEE